MSEEFSHSPAWIKKQETDYLVNEAFGKLRIIILSFV